MTITILRLLSIFLISRLLPPPLEVRNVFSFPWSLGWDLITFKATIQAVISGQKN
jgi:hypothetical protein